MDQENGILRLKEIELAVVFEELFRNGLELKRKNVWKLAEMETG